MTLKNNSRTGRSWQPSENSHSVGHHLCQQMLITSRERLRSTALMANCAMIPVSRKNFIGLDMTGRNVCLEHTEKERGQVLERGLKDHALEGH